MKNTIVVENIKCGGCSNTIVKSLQKIEGVTEVDINIETQEITIESDTEINMENITAKLAQLGYPLAGEGTGFQKAKSFVSCMIGRVS
jgi:copper chaperone CopZ